jgi:hypothetical protein
MIIGKMERFLDPKNRVDHIVPQVYMRGFIHPLRDQKHGRLEVFELSNRFWGEPRSADRLCSEIGFYDYSVDVAEETADDAFRELEGGLAEIRRKLRVDGFRGWTKDLDFLMRFSYMLVVRSKLFREGIVARSQKQIWLRVLDVIGRTIRYEPFDPRTEPEAQAKAKNLSITEMRTEIKKFANEWAGWNWGLYTSPDVLCPFITSEAPVVMDGLLPDGMRAYAEGKFRLVIPFGWDFALVGSPILRFSESPLELSIKEMDELRTVTTSGASEVLISPIRLLDMSWFGLATPAVPLMPR